MDHDGLEGMQVTCTLHFKGSKRYRYFEKGNQQAKKQLTKLN